uniref:tRNA(Ile)-lysidine synthase n=1 Tax=Rhodymenia pseudopalmata TaxID=31502 RepID=A0A1C9C7L9_RHOPU|nr:tRNA(Ile)-lysidine synthase [Rhodymenia pseudopalmata]AOM64371.1 tRNA(Ile)-lysidine synthase [Rhodymenia pseudopalmata]
MKTYIHKQFNSILKTYHVNSMLIAVSGGQDSLCLIKLTEDFIRLHKITADIEYIYIDHQWRQDSIYQAQHLVSHISQRKCNLSIYQIKNLTFSELDARHLRYQIIIGHAKKHRLSTVITAHTVTDAVETFIQKIIRGSSLDSATGLNMQRKISGKIQVIRPLIKFSRAELNWFCRKFFLPTWSDTTNYYHNINRNRLRHELIPYIKKYYSCSIENNLSKLINNYIIDNDYIKQNTIKLYLLNRHKFSIAINHKIIQKQHLALKIRILQMFFYHNFNKCLSNNKLYKLINIINKVGIESNLYTLKWKSMAVKISNKWIYVI